MISMGKLYYQSLISCFFLVIAWNVAAQQDLVVLTNGDTLRGVIKNVGANKTIIETTSSTLTIVNNEIKLYYDSEKELTYCRRVIPGSSQPVFITRLIDGPINFYSYKIRQGYGTTRTSTETWFAEKEGIPLGEVKAGGLRGGKKERKDFFRSLIADNPTLLKRFDEEEKYSIEFLESLIQAYNKQAVEN